VVVVDRDDWYIWLGAERDGGGAMEEEREDSWEEDIMDSSVR
jgi:hypothetical protein